jgi:hypothetical protein
MLRLLKVKTVKPAAVGEGIWRDHVSLGVGEAVDEDDVGGGHMCWRTDLVECGGRRTWRCLLC